MSKFYLNKISVYFSYNQFKYLKYILLHLFKFVFISFLLNVNKVLKHIRNIITKIVLSINIYKLNFFFKFIRLSILFFSLRTLKIITLLFLLSSLLDNLLISPSYAELQEIKEDWVCTDFGDKFCLFEDVYGCGVPDVRNRFAWYRIKQCVDTDKVIDERPCVIVEKEVENNLHIPFQLAEIDGETYVIKEKEIDFKYECHTSEGGLVCINENTHGIKTSSSPEEGKIYTIGGEIKGLVKKVLNAEEVLDVSGGKCGLMKDKGSCLKTCSSEKKKKKVKVKDENGNAKEIEIEESECDRLVTGGNWQEWYECSKGSEGSSYCKGGGSSEEYFKGSDKKQYLDKSCCAENNGYVKYGSTKIGDDNMSIVITKYYKVDKGFNVDDYVKVNNKYYNKKFGIMKFNKSETNKIRCLVSEYDNKGRPRIVIAGGSRCRLSHLSEDKIIVKSSNGSYYSVVYKYSRNLEDFVKYYYDEKLFRNNDVLSEASFLRFMVLNDSRCLKNKSSNCFLPQKETCLVNKRSEHKYCSVTPQSSCKVCVKWGIDIKELSLDGFKNAKFECTEYHTANWNDDIFMRLYDSIPNSWTDTKTPGSPYVPNTREGVVKYKGRAGASWGANIELREDKKCEYGRVCKNKHSYGRIDISDFKIGYNLEKYYNDRNWWYRDEIVDPDEAWIAKECSDQVLFKCRDGNTYECPNYAYQMWNDRYVFEVSGVSCNSGNYYWSSGSDQYCGSTNGPGYCLTRGYKCPEKSFDCKYHSQSRSISWMEPEFSVREVDIEEVYDPNLIVE